MTKDLKEIDLGDERLNTRMVRIVERLERRPSESSPQAMVTDAEVEAFYRLVLNKKATFDTVLKPHVDATLERCSESPVILAVHNSSEFRFSGKDEREGLGCVQQSGQGFLGHFVLAIAPGEIRC